MRIATERLAGDNTNAGVDIQDRDIHRWDEEQTHRDTSFQWYDGPHRR